MRKEGLSVYIHTEINLSCMYSHVQQLITCSLFRFLFPMIVAAQHKLKAKRESIQKALEKL